MCDELSGQSDNILEQPCHQGVSPPGCLRLQKPELMQVLTICHLAPL